MEEATYVCTVRDRYGNSAQAWFHVYVENNLVAHPENEAYEDAGYANFYVSPDSQLTLRTIATAADTSQLQYKWYRQVEEDGWAYEEIEGEETAEYTVLSVAGREDYRCKVSDQYGNTANAYFHVYIETNLEVSRVGEDSVDVAPGESVTLQVQATADEGVELSYTWRKGYDYGWNATGAGTDTVTFVPDHGSDTYECKVSDNYGNKEYVTFYVYVENQLNAWPDGKGENDSSARIEPVYGEPVTLKVNVSAIDNSQITYRWYVDGDRINGADTAEYVIGSATTAHTYRCAVEDQYYSYDSVTFYIVFDNHLNVYPEGMPGRDTAYLYVRPDERVTLHAVIEADDQEGMTISWYNDEWESTIPGGDTREVYGEPTEYSCSVQDKYGNSKTIYFVLRVENGFTAYPAGAEMDQYGEYRKDVHLYPVAGEELDLTVIATSDQGTLRYFWYRSKNIATSWGEYESQYVSMPEEAVAETRHVTATKKPSTAAA